MLNMNNIDLKWLSALEIGSLVNKREITPTSVLNYFRERIETRNKSINAFVYTKFDEAYQRAFELEKKLNNYEYCGPFAGVPFALKDFLPSKKGWTHSYGGVKSLECEDEYSSIFCDAMEFAGGIAIGKTNAPTYGFRGTTNNKLYGCTSTPFNTKYNSGGSSGGSAAAVADGLVPIAEGGDAGGSIRIPASFCNLFGFKAGMGFIPNICYPDAWSATHPFCMGGGLTKNVADATMLFNIMSRYDARDPYSAPQDLSNYHHNVGKLKIAYTNNFDLFPVEEKVLNAFKGYIQKLKDNGFNLTEVHFNFNHTVEEISEQWCKGITIDCALELNHSSFDLEKLSEELPEEFVYWKKICDKLTIEDMYKFNVTRTDILYQFNNVFKNYDILLSPVSCCGGILNESNNNTKGPSEINGKPVDSLVGWAQTYLANFIGYPAASIPAGLIDGIPFGVQVISEKYKDKLLLAFSEKLETTLPWKDNFNISFNREV